MGCGGLCAMTSGLSKMRMCPANSWGFRAPLTPLVSRVLELELVPLGWTMLFVEVSSGFFKGDHGVNLHHEFWELHHDLGRPLWEIFG